MVPEGLRVARDVTAVLDQAEDVVKVVLVQVARAVTAAALAMARVGDLEMLVPARRLANVPHGRSPKNKSCRPAGSRNSASRVACPPVTLYIGRHHSL